MTRGAPERERLLSFSTGKNEVSKKFFGEGKKIYEESISRYEEGIICYEKRTIIGFFASFPWVLYQIINKSSTFARN